MFHNKGYQGICDKAVDFFDFVMLVFELLLWVSHDCGKNHVTPLEPHFPFFENVRPGIVLLMNLPSSSSGTMSPSSLSHSAGLFMISPYTRSSRAKEGADG